MADETPTDPVQPRPRGTRRRSAADKVRAKEFPAAMRGYEREAVDAWKEEVAELVARLEVEPPRDVAVKKALDEVGQETSAILQRAHESADEIEARSRSRADARLRRAEGEAEITVREAEERADRLDEDIRAMWDQRVRLIEEMRQLADEVLGVADDALDRLAPPRGREPEEAPVDAAEEEEDVFDEPGSDEVPDAAPGPAGALDDTQVLKVPEGDTQPFDAFEDAAAEDESTDESPAAEETTDEAPAAEDEPTDESPAAEADPADESPPPDSDPTDESPAVDPPSPERG